MEFFSRLAQLLLKHLNDELTAEESACLQDWIEQSDTNRQFFADVANVPALLKETRAYKKGVHLDWKTAWEKLNLLEPQAPAMDEPQSRRWHLCFIEV